MTPYGFTRSVVRRNYALLTPDTFVPGVVAGWSDAVCHTHISPQLGAGFIQRAVVLGAKGKGVFRPSPIERLIYVQSGSVSVRCAAVSKELPIGGFAFFPAGESSEIHALSEETRLVVFEKKYLPMHGTTTPEALAGMSEERPEAAFLGDPDARLRVLLPDHAGWDMAVNIFTYQPGARLPMVEVHVMEHGLVMLQGEGIYRLGEDWFPVQPGDVIWMGPHCPQWFGALGKQPAAYLYYKDVNRHEL